MRLATIPLIALGLLSTGCQTAQNKGPSPNPSATERPQNDKAVPAGPPAQAVAVSLADPPPASAKKAATVAKPHRPHPTPEQVEAKQLVGTTNNDRLTWTDAELKARGISYDHTQK